MKSLLHLFTASAFSIICGSTISQAASVNTIWVDNATNGPPIIQEYDLTTGALLDQINAPNGSNGRGIVQIGNDLYYTSATTGSVFEYNYVTNTDLGTVFTIPGASGLSTIAYDGHSLYVGDYSGTNAVYKYSLGGTLQQTLHLANCTGYCDGLEYANGYLIENEGDADNIYDKYDLSGNIVKQDFITGTPGGSTGIAFDGTNYYTDNVFTPGSVNEYDSAGNFIKTLNFSGQNYYAGEDLSVNYSVVIPSTVPLPPALPMFGAALLGLGAVGYRLKRKSTLSV
ncbi:YncE family protein [Lichenifustis flavocetrariae]|uniref:Uncharacterized protein n=1 Tax=Lichenifustis flavocetrariae TaxID=2949735 RepID=A0AA41Z6A4_9HYPH|nr:hypothetical protein [Lichenifustis flavocetrariae]MCW6511288.1 hypothetical protein [Lichenifustis flavocetrariae]